MASAAPGTIVRSNGLPVPFDGAHFAPLRDSTGAAGDFPSLRRNFDEDGYVLVRGVLDRDSVVSLRRRYFSTFDRTYLRPGTDAADGVWSGRPPADLPAHGTPGHPAHAFVRSPEFLRLCADPRLAELAVGVLGTPATQLPRRILRHFDRSRPAASRAHTDFSYLDAGSDRIVTLWIPLGDCPLATGGLVYLEASHRLDASAFDGLRGRTDRRHDSRPISHDLGWVCEQLGRRWLWTDYRAGDVVVHSPHIVHASLDVTTDEMRLSADLRWLADGAARDERWSSAWSGDDGK